MASSYFICCTNLETKLPEHFKVPHSIYVYVKQLEYQLYKLEKENGNECLNENGNDLIIENNC